MGDYQLVIDPKTGRVEQVTISHTSFNSSEEMGLPSDGLELGPTLVTEDIRVGHYLDLRTGQDVYIKPDGNVVSSPGETLGALADLTIVGEGVSVTKNLATKAFGSAVKDASADLALKAGMRGIEEDIAAGKSVKSAVGSLEANLTADGKSFAGHGGIMVDADGTLPTTIVPEGTYVTVPVGPNRGLYNSAGQKIESGNIDAGLQLQREYSLGKYGVDTTEGAATYLPGAKMPDYRLFDPNFGGKATNPLPGSIIVDTPTPLSELLQPNMGCVNWAACTHVWGSAKNPLGSGGFKP